MLATVNVDEATTRTRAKPFCKYAGGKRWLAPYLTPKLYDYLAKTNGCYFEPFVGGGAIALDLGLGDRMVLTDTCKPLINTYLAVRKNPQAVAWALKTLVDRGTDKESYLKVRASETTSVVFSAARFLYLTKFGFNGLWRENSKGEMNVPHGGDRSAASLPSEAELGLVGQAIKGADIRVADFREVVRVARAGDVIYADPPYYATFSGYSAGGFDEDDHIELALALRGAHERGAWVVASNSGHDRVYELYRAWARVEPIHERHMIGATGDRRGLRDAVLISTANV